MTLIASEDSPLVEPRARPRRRARPRDVAGTDTAHEPRRTKRILARYTAPAGALREVVAVDGSAGCVLVMDRNRLTGDDARVVAHLAADEPPENAAIASAMFVRQASEQCLLCRPVVAEDFTAAASRECGEAEPEPELRPQAQICDRHGRVYRLEAVAGPLSIPELRWRRHPQLMARTQTCTVSVREAIAAVEAYEPIRTMTRSALTTHRGHGDVSVAVLRLELDRVLCSPIVLNRKLRETALALSASQGLSMSEIAMRCGRVKRDRGGGASGETSWLARRLGLLPEGGRDRPTPWIHTEVLALIARRGLGVSPREVEPD